jgi:hypothetical protein
MQKTLEQLCGELIAAKQTETDAVAQRINVEMAIIQQTGMPDEGSKTVDAEGYKIKIEQRITRKIDPKSWALVVDQIPEQLRPVSIKEQYVVENKGVLWLKEKEPGYYKLLCSCMTETPNKPAVKVEVL